MTARVRNVGVVVAGAALLASGAYALGSQEGNGSASASGSPQRATAINYGYAPPGAPPRGFDRHRFRGGHGLGLQGLADKLGVRPAALRAALDGVRQDMPSKTDLAAKLADALGVPVDKVTSALGRFGPREHHDITAALAKALDLDTAKVQAALDKVKSQFRPGRGADRTDFEAALAKELGVSTDKLTAALRSLRPERGHRERHDRGASLNTLADTLGVTPAQL